MLRIHLLQIAYNMSDPQMEDFLHENSAARKFVGLALADRTPDESTILQFRHLLEKRNLGKQVLERVNDGITAAGLALSKGRIVDASFIEAPSSTKNRDHKRDPEMSSGKKGNTWHVGMKLHEHDISRARELIPSETEQVYGDAGYVGMEKREEFQTDREAEKRSYRINLRPGVLKGRSAEDLIRKIEHFKSSVRCKVEHVKLQMSYRKTRYRGIAKNAHRINTMLALCNLFTFDCYLKRLTA